MFVVILGQSSFKLFKWQFSVDCVVISLPVSFSCIGKYLWFALLSLFHILLGVLEF